MTKLRLISALMLAATPIATAKDALAKTDIFNDFNGTAAKPVIPLGLALTAGYPGIAPAAAKKALPDETGLDPTYGASLAHVTGENLYPDGRPDGKQSMIPEWEVLATDFGKADIHQLRHNIVDAKVGFYRKAHGWLQSAAKDIQALFAGLRHPVSEGYTAAA
jgi:hypothetical protein